jgi:AraC-like DNA-binding protein
MWAGASNATVPSAVRKGRRAFSASSSSRVNCVSSIMSASVQPFTSVWTLADLARDVGFSRSALADRFTHFVGLPPMQYLTQWRMQVAARLLSDGVAKVSAVGRDVGYDSEAAFSRAFKKVTGVPPARWRGVHATNRGADGRL